MSTRSATGQRLVRCAASHREHYPVGSSSSSKTYPVKAFRDNELPSCTCVGFMTSRNKNANRIGGGYAGAGAGLAQSTAATCRHLKEVLSTECDWRQQPGEQAQLVCPKCLGPVVYADTTRLPAGRGGVPESAIPLGNRPNPYTQQVAPKRVAKKAAAKKVAPPDPTAIIAIMQDLAKDSTPTSSAPAEAKDDPVAKLKAITAKKAAKKVDASDAAAELAKLLDNA